LPYFFIYIPIQYICPADFSQQSWRRAFWQTGGQKHV